MPNRMLVYKKQQRDTAYERDAYLSAGQITTSCNISHNTGMKILKAAEVAGIFWPLPEDLDDATLEKLLYPEQNKGTSETSPNTSE